MSDNREQANRIDRSMEADANKMGTAPVGRLLASMAWPAIVSMTILALYNIVDSVFVGMISKDALAAVSFVNPLQMLMISVAVGSSVGVNSLISRRLGARRFEEANKAASTSIRIGLFNWVIFACVGIFISRPFMGIYTSDEVIFNYGIQYLQIVTVGSIFSMVSVQMEKVLQATGNMIAPMVISMCGAVTNLILDPVLIFGLFGLPRLEVTGAAIATITGQFVSVSVAFLLFFRKKRDVTIHIRHFKIDWQVVKDIYAVGLPSMIMQSIGSILIFFYNGIIASSATAVAVLGVYFKLQGFVFMPVFGLNQGAMPIMGYNFGARNRKRLMECFWKGFAAAFVILGLGLILFQTKPDLLLSMFSADEEMMEVGIPALRLISICFIPASFGIMCSTLFQATGHGLYSMFASLLRQLFGVLPSAYFLYHTYGLNASWASFPLAEIIGTIYAISMLVYLYKKEIKYL